MGWQEWVRTVEIEPWLNAADPSTVDRQVDALLRAGCRLFHLDLVDGESLLPETLGAIIADSIGPLLRRYEGVLDVHLRVADPLRHLADLAAGGTSSVTLSYEGVDLSAAVAAVRAHGLQTGIAVGEGVEPADVAAYAGEVDLFVYLADSRVGARDVPPDTARRVHNLVRALPARTPVQVKGGVGHDNLRDLYDAGATIFVVGEPIYEREDLPRAYRRLVHALA